MTEKAGMQDAVDLDLDADTARDQQRAIARGERLRFMTADILLALDAPGLLRGSRSEQYRVLYAALADALYGNSAIDVVTSDSAA